MMGLPVVFLLIQAYIGVKGNKMADKLAKAAADGFTKFKGK